MYLYPTNLKSKPMLGLWTLKDVSLIGICTLISLLFLTQLGILIPLVITVIYAILSLKVENTSVLEFIIFACNFCFMQQQTYYWKREERKYYDTK